MVRSATYVPKRGDAVWLNFNPQAGHEQAGHRPAVVLSPEAYSAKTGLAIFCPITNQVKGYPFEVTLPAGLEVSGVILSDQVMGIAFLPSSCMRSRVRLPWLVGWLGRNAPSILPLT